MQAAHQTRRLSQPPSRRRANSLPAPALARPSAAPEPDLGRPLGPSSAESASSLPCLAGQGLLSRLQAPDSRLCPPLPPGRASKPDCTQRRADASRARAGSGPGRTWRRRRYRGPRDAPSRPLRRTPAPLPLAGSGLAFSSATSGSSERTPRCPSLPPGPRHLRSARQPWSHAFPQGHHGPRCPSRASPRDNGSTRPPPQLGHRPRSLG